MTFEQTIYNKNKKNIKLVLTIKEKGVRISNMPCKYTAKKVILIS